MTHPQARHLTASAVVLDLSRALVLLVHHKATGAWMFPGGHLDPGEDLAQAALREVGEETGVRAEILSGHPGQLPGMTPLPAPWLVCDIPAPAKPDRGPGKPAEAAHTHVDHLFIATADAQQSTQAALGEVHGVRWFALHSLPPDARAEVPEVAALAWQTLTADAQRPLQSTGLETHHTFGVIEYN